MRVCKILFALLLLSAPVAAQPAPPPPTASTPPEQGVPPLPPREVARLLDAYAVMQAQDALGLDEAQYGRFIPRFKALLDTRRRNQGARARLVQELSRMTRAEAPPPDEAALRDRLRAIDEQDARAAGEARKALDGVDEVLTLVQRAKFRVFEEQVERRKLDLVARARQGARLGRGPRREQDPQ